MKKFQVLLCLFAGMCYAQFGVSLGFGPYHGMTSVEYTMKDEHLSTNIHLMGYDLDYDFMGGVGVAYRFSGLTGTYAFHSSEWIHGEFEGFVIHNVGREDSYLEETFKEINYWRLVFGFGYQHMFAKHFGAYFELGFQFFAGNGGYYTNFDINKGSLDCDRIVFPGGLGVVAEF